MKEIIKRNDRFYDVYYVDLIGKRDKNNKLGEVVRHFPIFYLANKSRKSSVRKSITDITSWNRGLELLSILANTGITSATFQRAIKLPD